MKDAQKPDHISLNTLVNRLREGRFVIPDFQREFEWNPWDIRELMRSIFLDYYIGSLLLWKGKDESFKALSCEPIQGFQGDGNPNYIVLDGQQRLTAIFYAFLAPNIPLPNRANKAVFFVRVDKFMAEDYDEAFNYDWLSKRWSKVLDNQTIQYQEHIFPLSIIGSGGWDLYEWVKNYQEFWESKAKKNAENDHSDEYAIAQQHAINAQLFGEHLKGITEQYQISFIELDKELAIDKVCDIFTQINSRGIRLDVFDLVNALLKPKGLQLKHMWRKAASRLDFVDTPKMNVYVLQVMSILRQAYCSPKYLYFLLPGEHKPIREPDGTRRKEILISDGEEFEERWNIAVAALEHAIKLLRHPQEFGAISSNYLPYVSILPVFAAMQTHIKSLQANKQLEAQRKIRKWYWASVFINRYSGSVESTSARDYLDMKEWIDDNEKEPQLIQEFKESFKNLELRKEVKKGSSIYNGIFNLFILQGARDWMTGNVPQFNELDDHHIIPASWGKEHIEGNLIHTILNRTPLTAITNRKVINDRLPNEYLPELIKENGETTVRSILESHFISINAQKILLRDPFTPDDYDLFLNERRLTIIEAIENLLIKERLDLSPQLRELDQSVELIELSLRSLISSTFNDDSSHIPEYISSKVDERIHRAVKKTATIDANDFHLLSKKLQFFDLRELQQVIVNKSIWTNFESRFVNKDTLAKKFDQLAELRNCIRHSRTVDEITRKEGEAAIIWFDQVLK